MNKVKKILTTLMAATLTVSTGLTSMPMFAHNVKAESLRWKEQQFHNYHIT